MRRKNKETGLAAPFKQSITFIFTLMSLPVRVATFFIGDRKMDKGTRGQKNKAVLTYSFIKKNPFKQN
jgi:hypothetical protein